MLPALHHDNIIITSTRVIAAETMETVATTNGVLIKNLLMDLMSRRKIIAQLKRHSTALKFGRLTVSERKKYKVVKESTREWEEIF